MAYPLLLHASHQKTDVLYETLGPWVVPWRFASFDTEYAALRHSAGLIDYSSQAFICVEGPDRAGFLHNLLTQAIKQLTPGNGAPAALLTANGKLVAEFMVLCNSDSLWLMCDASVAGQITQTLNRYLFSEQVKITNHEREQAVFAIEGPKSFEMASQIFGSSFSPSDLNSHQRTVVEGIPLWLIQYSLTGKTGVLCAAPAREAETIWQLLQQKGKKSGLVLAGWEALNTTRIEAGIPWFGIDMNEDNLLPETGLESTTVNDNKGCYLGQEIIARLGTYGSTNKKLMGLRIEGTVIPGVGAKIIDGTDVVGEITSACYSPLLKQPIALGYLKRGYYEPGKSVTIQQAGELLKASVVQRPLV